MAHAKEVLFSSICLQNLQQYKKELRRRTHVVRDVTEAHAAGSVDAAASRAVIAVAVVHAEVSAVAVIAAEDSSAHALNLTTRPSRCVA